MLILGMQVSPILVLIDRKFWTILESQVTKSSDTSFKQEAKNAK